MARAHKLARNAVGLSEPNPRVGCVVVNNGDVVGEGWTQPAGQAHAEVVALTQAGAKANGATVYTTLEPCSHTGKTPPCAGTLVNAKVAKVVYASGDPNPEVDGKGAHKMREAGIEVLSGLQAEKTVALNKGFFWRMQTGLPWVTVKMAATLDGRTAAANGASKWITSADARADVHTHRKRSSCVLTGIGTVLADDPTLNARTAEGNYFPAIAIMDTRLRTPVNAKVLWTGAKVFVFTCSTDEAATATLRKKGVEVVTQTGERLDIENALRYLAKQGVNEVWTEAGATLCGAVIAAGCVNQLVLYLAPFLLGNSAKGLFELPALKTLEQKIPLTISDVRNFGDDLRITANVTTSK